MSTTDRNALLPRFLLAGFLVVVLLQFIALILPWDRVWGFDMLRYLGMGTVTGYAFVVIFAAGLLEYLRRKERIPDERLLLTLALIFAALLVAFPIDTFFYGDGGLLIPQIHRYSVDGSYEADILLNTKSSPLAGALLVFFMKQVPALLPWKPTTALYPFIWLSAVSLLAAVVYIWRSYRGIKRVVTLIALVGSAGGLLFRGYPEFYAPVFAAIAVYLVAGERTARGQSPLWHVIVAFVFAVAVHYMALILLPSLVVLILARKQVRGVENWSLREALVLTGVIFGIGQAVYWMAFAYSDSRIVMPAQLLVTEAGLHEYTLLSLSHLLDFLNLLVLIAPLALLTVLLLWSRQLRREKRPDATTVFHALNVLFFLVFTFFVNASLGLPRDWDLVSPLGIILMLAGVALMEYERIKYGALALVLASAVLLAPWHELHRSPDATAERFANIMTLNEEHIFGDYSLSGYEALRKYARRQGDLKWEIALTRRMIERVGYAQHHRELGELIRRQQSTDVQAASINQQWQIARLKRQADGITRDHFDYTYAIDIAQIDSLTQAIGMHALSNGTYREIAIGIDNLGRITRRGKPYPAITGSEHYNARLYDSAIVHFDRALQEGFHTPGLYLLYGNALALSQRYSESLSRFEEGVRRYPIDGMLRFTLGKYYVRARIQPERAAELLQWCIEHQNPAEKVEEARVLLYSLVQ